jgi:hypothetical protein
MMTSYLRILLPTNRRRGPPEGPIPVRNALRRTPARVADGPGDHDRATSARGHPAARFQETVVFSGLTQPTVVRFASDGRVFVAEKRGVIKVFDSCPTPRRPPSPT